MEYKLNQVCFRTLEQERPASLATYLSLGGYEVWKEILKTKPERHKLLEQIKTSMLRGRGGAGFPTGLKWSFMPKGKQVKYIVCNSDESEPGTCKDRDILRYNPHQVIEGMAIAGYLMQAETGYNYVRGEYVEPAEIFDAALAEAKEYGLLGNDLFASGITFNLYNKRGAGAYICGEETALLESLEGKKGMPRFKPPFPANYGLYGEPTNINNTESFASVPVILQKGGDWFLAQGTEKSGGTKIFSVSGHVNNPGNFEIPMGLPFPELLKLAGGMWKGKKLKAVIPGGSSVPVITADEAMSMTMDYESIAEKGSMLGSGAVIIMDEDTCMVDALTRISKFYMVESCGQCTPCREGTGWLYRILVRFQNKTASQKDLKLLYDIAGNIKGNTICALGDAAAMPVQSFIDKFKQEFLDRITDYD